jgi:MFS transporter, OPA family, sugar phosphate sensor protein UhpC
MQAAPQPRGAMAAPLRRAAARPPAASALLPRPRLPTALRSAVAGATAGGDDPTRRQQQQQQQQQQPQPRPPTVALVPPASAAAAALAAPAPAPDVSARSGGGSTAAAGDMPTYPPAFVARRLLTFACIVLGYSCYYLTRNSLTYTAPVMVADAALGLDITMIGAMTSIFPIAYGMSKFVSGVLGARFSPSQLLAGGLMATALINIAFGFGTSLAWFCVCWGLNGTLQGVGGPCCARILTTWFASKERGTYWGMWNIAHNLGGFAAPLVAGGFAKAMGWKWGMWAPGIIGLAVGAAVLLLCRDKPEDVGFPPVEPTTTTTATKAATPTTAAAATAAAAGSDGEKPKATEKKKPDVLKQLVNTVLKNPFIWGMALTYFFIYVVRQGVTSWFVFYLIKEKGVADAAQAAVRVSGLELGGLFGSLIAGRLSDGMIRAAAARAKPGEAPREGNVGKRVQVVMAYTVGIAAALLAFQACPATMPWLQWANVFMIGFFLYGPQMLIGLCGAELVGPDSVGASEGFLGWIAYLGAANAGVPLSIIVKEYGWGAYFTALLSACALALVLLSPMVNLKSHVQRLETRAVRKREKGM